MTLSGKLLIEVPADSTKLQREVWDWAAEALIDALDETRFVEDNPGIDTDPAEQLADLIDRLDVQLRQMTYAEPALSRQACSGAIRSLDLFIDKLKARPA